MTLRSVSATQIKQHRSCALQWYLQRVEGWQMPQSPSQALGEAIHKQVEDYLLDGKNPDLPSVENAIKKGLVPPTGGTYLVEEPKDYGMVIRCADVPVKGRIDLLIPPASGESLVKVVDWKSASSFRYVPEPDALTRDVQGVLYLKYAFSNYPFATHGQFRHVYLLTKGTGSKKVDAEVVDRDFIDGQWAHIEATVEEMKATASRALPVVAATQANLSHCSNYGGCSFRDRCPAASKGLVASMIEAESQTSASGEGITMSTLAEKLKARKAATQSSPSVATPVEVATPVVVEPVVETKVETPVVEAKAETPVVEAKAETKAKPKAKSVPEPIGIVPPDAPGGDLVHEKHDGIKAEVEAFIASMAEPVSAPVVEPVVVPEAKVEYVEDPVTTSAPAKTLSLFIDCYPERAPFENLHALEDEIAERTPSLLEHLRKTSPKDVPEGTVDLGEVLFGRGYSTLSASFALKPITGAWTVSTLGPASSKVLEVLLPKATLVVRGRR
jgi:hypothetical protein